MYGTQAKKAVEAAGAPFENDVNMYGTQAEIRGSKAGTRLRMM